MTRFVFACDSFKGTISSRRAAELLAHSARVRFPAVSCTCVQVADGGEGTVDAVVAATDGELIHVEVSDPLGRSVCAHYGMLPEGRAVIEMATASGLPLLVPDERNPLATSSYGTGQLIADALARGATDVSIAIGGSATNDAGMGCMRALGARFLDADGEDLAGVGSDLGRVESIDVSGMDGLLGRARFHVMCDVDNPLVGPRGATRVFAPQKGARPAVVRELEDGMASFAGVLARTFGVDVSQEPGMGAAGGLAAAARLFLSAEVVSGVDWVLDLVGLTAALEGADLCITGEGHADSQSSHGKVVSGVSARCRVAGVACVAIVGGMDPGALGLLSQGVDALVPTALGAGSVADALSHAERNFALAADRTFSLLALGRGMGECS